MVTSMRKYVFIGAGCFFGAAARYLVKLAPILGYPEYFPLNTLIVNIAGSFSLALIITIFLEIWQFDADVRLGLTTGFLGAFTTFSTLCKEAVLLLQTGNYLSAVSYMTISMVLGLGAAYLGVVISGKFLVRLVGSFRNSAETGNESDVD